MGDAFGAPLIPTLEATLNYALFIFPVVSAMFLYMLIDLLFSSEERMRHKFPEVDAGKILSFKKLALAMVSVIFLTLLSASLFLWLGENTPTKIIACFLAPFIMLIVFPIFKALSSSMSIGASNKSPKPTR